MQEPERKPPRGFAKMALKIICLKVRPMKKATRKEIEAIRTLLLERYSGAVTELAYKNLYELVIAVALSAQCTDKRVNLITPALFEKYPDPATLSGEGHPESF